MALNVLATMSILFEMAFLCHPLAYNWDPSTPGGGCGNRNASSVSSDMVNLFTDIMVIALPLPTIWHLHLPLRPKLGLMLVFSLGMFILRLQSLYAISFTDPTFTLPMVLMWSVLEAELLVIAANLPTLRPILARLFPSVFGTPRATEAISGRSRRARPLTGRARMQFDTSILSRLESGTATNESASNGSRLSNGAGEKALPVVVLPLGCNPEHWRDEDRIAGC
ncbi:hypothetical protein MMC13_007273 [Lambiella insularis]|nr:hypothetical protein [Lambiella insularis]